MSDLEDPYVRRQLRALAGRAPDPELGLNEFGGRLERARRRRVMARGAMASLAGVAVVGFAAVATVTAKPAKTNVKVTADRIEQSTAAASTTASTIVVAAGKSATSVTLPAREGAGSGSSLVPVAPTVPPGSPGRQSGSGPANSEPRDHTGGRPPATNANPPDGTEGDTVPPPVVTPPETITTTVAVTTTSATSQPSTTKPTRWREDDHSDTTDD